MKIITVNKNIILSNKKQGKNDPPIRVTTSKYAKPQYFHEYEFTGKGKFVYSPDNPLPCGARLWLELED